MKTKKGSVKIIYALLISMILLGIIFALKLLPITSFGADTKAINIGNNLEKYINYYLSEEDNGTLVQYNIETKIEYGEKGKIPVKESELTVQLGAIDNKYPKEVKVISKNDFESTNQYNQTTGTLVIQSDEQNDKENCNYIVICYYDTYTEETLQRDLEIKTIAKSLFADEEEITISKEEEFKYEVAENIGKLTSVNNQSQEIYNGYMKSNKINKTNYTTEYDQIDQIMISKKEAQQALEIQENNMFISQEKNQEQSQEQSQEETVKEIELGNNNNIVYKTTKIQEKEIKEILGEEGKVEFIDEEGNVIDKIDKDTEFDESGIYTVNYENEPTKITIKTSEIKNEGYLNIRNTKQIKENAEFVENMGIKTIIQLNEIQYEEPEEVSEEETPSKEEKETEQELYEFKTEIKDATTKIDVNIDNTNWSNKEQNEVTFEIKLEANTIKDNMLKNPYIEIELPSQVEKVILGESNIVYANNLQLNEPSININKRGNKVIAVSLTGIQNEYYTNELDLSTNISIPATIILSKQMEESTEEKINVAYANQYTTDNSYEIGAKELELKLENYKEEEIKETQEVNTIYEVAQQILVENSDALSVEITPVKGEITLKNNDVVYEGEYIKYNIKITNASEQDINNVKVVANIPEGVTYGELETNCYEYRSDYKYNFDATLRQRTIQIPTIKSGETITQYYEVKVDDLQEGEESKQIITNIDTYIGEELAKTYTNTNTVNQAEVKLFLGAYIDYTAWGYYLNLYSDTSEEIETKIHLPKEFKLEEIYYLPQTKDGDVFAEGADMPSSKLVYTNYETLPSNMEQQIRDIEVEISNDNTVTAKLHKNSYYAFRGQMNTSKTEKDPNECVNQLIAWVEATGKNTYSSNENRYDLAYQNINITMTSPTEGEKVKYNEEINYEIEVKNIGKKNVYLDGEDTQISLNLTDFLPEEVIPVEIIYNNWELETSEDGETSSFVKKDEIKKDISTIFTDENDNRLPNIELVLNIPKDETVKIKVKTIADYLSADTKIENSATIKGEKIDTKTSNTVSHIILSAEEYNPDDPSDPDDPDEPDEPDNPNDPSGPSNPSTPSDPSDPNNPSTPEEKYSISGTAWVDENEDGKRDVDEKVLSGIPVILVDMNDKTIDKETVETNSVGKYKFENIEKGNYVVIFQYDTKEYNITQYHKSNIEENVNSDVINKTVTLDGNKTVVGITDTINLNEDISNLDIGLIENKLCDFKVDKYISNVTVKTTKGTTQYNFKDQNLPKLEIKGNEIEGANVTVEYQIVITNIGETEGTVEKVIDYLPNGLELATSVKNDNWSKNTNGQVINTSLANTKIEAEDSVTLTLIATRNMTANSTGTLKNKVEIQNVVNTKNIQDQNTENNTDNIELIISIKTGAIVYTSIVIAALGILLAIIIILSKKRKN